MSEATEEPQSWHSDIESMIEFAEDILTYGSGLDRDAFVNKKRTFDTTLRRIEVLGLAAANIPNDVREVNPHIEWREIVATRNLLAHAFSGSDGDILWGIVQRDVPVLLPKLQKLLEDAQPEPG